MKLGEVGGIFNLAVSLQDGIFENQSEEKFENCLAPKAKATKYLDLISQILCPHLHYFVAFSSVSCGRGNPGQSNYGMANSVMERIMEERNKLGLPAKAIQWGAVGEVGIVADLLEDKIDIEIGGTLQQRISSCLQELDYLLTSPHSIVASMVVAEKNLTSSNTKNILDVILNVMSIKDIKKISLQSTLADLGMDSLMTVEIQQILEREFDVKLTPQELRSMTLNQIQKVAIKNSSEHLKKDEKVKIGYEMLLRNLGDEKNAAETILKLNSIKSDDVKVLMIPGIEGVAGKIWFEIGKELKFPSFLLQTFNTWKAKTLNQIFDGVVEVKNKKK